MSDGPQRPGWYSNRGDMDDLAYFDGHRWTWRRHRDASGRWHQEALVSSQPATGVRARHLRGPSARAGDRHAGHRARAGRPRAPGRDRVRPVHRDRAATPRRDGPSPARPGLVDAVAGRRDGWLSRAFAPAVSPGRGAAGTRHGPGPHAPGHRGTARRAPPAAAPAAGGALRPQSAAELRRSVAPAVSRATAAPVPPPASGPGTLGGQVPPLLPEAGRRSSGPPGPANEPFRRRICGPSGLPSRRCPRSDRAGRGCRPTPRAGGPRRAAMRPTGARSQVASGRRRRGTPTAPRTQRRRRSGRTPGLRLTCPRRRCRRPRRRG